MSAIAKAQNAWGENIPDWIEALANACDEANSQNQVAKRLKISGAQVSQVLTKQYKGTYSNTEEIVRSQLMAEEHLCPALHFKLSLARCLENQNRLKAGTMSGGEAVFFKNSCPNCPFFKHK